MIFKTPASFKTLRGKVMKVTPDLRSVKPVPGNRYMINPKMAGKFGAPVFSYNKFMMEQNRDLIEWTPKFIEPTVVTDEPVAVEGEADTGIEIVDEPIVLEATAKVVETTTNAVETTTNDDPKKPMTPIEKARAARAQKQKG
jgi:hypothetical protein